MSDTPQPSTQDPTAAGSWSRVQIYLERLSEALADLDELGGVAGVVVEQNWRPGKVEKARANLKAIRDQLDAGLARLKAGRRRG